MLLEAIQTGALSTTLQELQEKEDFVLTVNCIKQASLHSHNENQKQGDNM
jgi:hypothetical protein